MPSAVICTDCAKPVFGCIFVDGLTKRHPVSPIVVSTIDFDVALITVTPGSAHHKCTRAGGESYRKSQLITSSIWLGAPMLMLHPRMENNKTSPLRQRQSSIINFSKQMNL
jgi:hypothetical protein